MTPVVDTTKLKPGDPAPPVGEGRGCAAQHDPEGHGWPWLCTLADGHAGQHVASGADTVLAVWPNDSDD
jgi:hypothetical protein